MNINDSLSNNMPEGLGFTMAMNVDAMKNFSKMTEEERNRFMEESRQVKSKSEMNQLVERLGKNMF
ncbi:MAG: hypothetical protein K2N51_00385 [Lachnospiraceae bacterium]|nr:hypothetical protein [Lachnospiraceae bacterium]